MLADGPPVELADFADGAGPGRQPQHQDAVLDAVMRFHQRIEQQHQQLLAGGEATRQAGRQQRRWQPGG